jgi:predicted double-glycine peptidase
MVLECYGHFVAEAYVREICECDDTGTEPSKVVKAVSESFNLTKSRTNYLTLEELQNELAQNLYPIVYLDLLEQGLQNCHAVVVIKIVEDKVFAIDPEIGERIFNRDEFNHVWSRTNGRTIIIE